MKKLVCLMAAFLFLEISYGQENPDSEQSRNVLAVGYQIGGYTLVGIDYEVRVHDFLGIHFGMGYTGYTAGVKIHTNEKKNSPFFNVSYKDAGFGLLKALGLEFGGRLVFSKKSEFGLHFQIGLAKILEIEENFEEILFDNKEAPPYMLSLGIGFSW
jgi:hypothetical protein